MIEGCNHSSEDDGFDKLEQSLVRDLFDSSSTFWTQLYQQKSLFAIIHRQRQAIALRYVSELSLPKTARVLEIGSGAGFMSLALADRGFTIEALDCSREMIKVAQNNAKLSGLDKKIRSSIGDVHNLAFQDQSFNLIIALGVTPWLHDVRKALSEIARVLVPGGYVVLNADNLFRLNELFDPWHSPISEMSRAWIRKKICREGLQNSPNFARPHGYSVQKFNVFLHEAKLKNSKNTNLGFGPFLLFSHFAFPDRIGVKINRKLQQYSDRGFPILRSTGAQYIVLAMKE